MQRGISLTELASRIEGNKALKQDMVADSKATQMVVDEEGVTALEAEDHGRYPIMPIAAGQIADRLKIPTKYYNRMAEEAPSLLANNVNEWLGRSDDRRMLRTLGGDLRAYMSDKYLRIEHEQIAEVALPIFAAIPNVSIISCELTDRKMYIQVVFNDLVDEVRGGVVPNDIVKAGVILENSEVGLGGYNIFPLIMREWCTNGCKINDGAMRKRHLGRQQDEGLLIDFKDDTKMAQDEALMLEARDTILACTDEATFAMRVNSMSGLTEAKVTGDPIKAVEVLAQKVGASQEEGSGILRSLIENGDLSAWGMLNAVTAQAHNADVSYDRAVEFEAEGGKLLEMPKSEWTRVLEAA